MNKCIIKSLVVALVLLVPCLAFALPGAHDPTSGRGYTCNSCHTSGSTIGNQDTNTATVATRYSTNVCFRCHKTGGAAGNAASKFETEDFANPFGTVVNISQASKLQSSHKWFGSDVVPAAGAVAPVDTAVNGLNKNVYFKGTIFCARCHNVHGSSGAPSLSKPYLRYPNDQDQMCFNCHAPRNTTNHILGTHPVNITYTSATAKVKIAAGTLLAAPVVNVANPTGQVKLVNGKILCSTCHGVHNSDSRSSTFDPFSSNHTFGQLSSSKGHLLRVDPYGKTVNDLNICTNCHAKKKSHNLGGRNGTQPVQCNDCHSGHVEYDPAAVGAETIKNVNVIRRYLQYSTAGRKSKRIFFRYTGATTKEFTNVAGKGVCQGCHNLPNVGGDNHFQVDGTFPNIPDTDRKDCIQCHSHTQTAGSYSYGASSNCLSACHGWPPVNNATSGLGSRTAGYIGYDESTTPHGSHAAGGTNYYNFDCNQCHKGYAMPQVPSTTQSYYREVFINATGVGIYSGINTTPTYSPTYNLTPSTCNNVYCHSRGNSGALQWKAGQNAVQWGENTKDTIIGQAGATRCNVCHDTAMATGAHTRHLISGFGYGCVNCHATTVSNNTTLRDAAKQLVGSHVNGIRNVEFNDVSPAVGTTCATIACHSNGKGAAPVQLPVWGTSTTGQCGDCHKTKTFGNLSTGGHKTAAHVSSDADCVRCHTYNGETSAPHVDGNLVSNVNYGGTGCAVNACHGSITAPTWSASYTGKDTCTKCHGTLTDTGVITAVAENQYLIAPSDPAATDTGKVSGNVKIGAHQTHLRHFNGFTNYSTPDYYCQACHGTPLPTLGTHADGTSSPTGKFRSLASNWGARTGGSAPTYSGTTCSNTYCHNPAGAGGTLDAADVGTDPSPFWNFTTYINGGKTDTNCRRCHKSPGSPSFAKQGAHGSNVTVVDYNCTPCHGHSGDTTGAPGQRHMDGKYYANGACDSCHGYPPVKDMTGLGTTGNFKYAKLESFNGGYAGGGGYHTKHLLATVDVTEQFAPCLPCHPQTSHQQGGTIVRGNIQVNDAADTSYRFDSSRSKRYNSTDWKCSNVSCHFRPTPTWFQ